MFSKFFKGAVAMGATGLLAITPLAAFAADDPAPYDESPRVSDYALDVSPQVLSESVEPISEPLLEVSSLGDSNESRSEEPLTPVEDNDSSGPAESRGSVGTPLLEAPEESVDQRVSAIAVDESQEFGEVLEGQDGIYFVDGIEESEADGPMARITFLQDMTNKVRALGGTDAVVKTANIVCGMNAAIGCASSPNIITFANRMSNYSDADKWAVAAHELGHIRHLAQWYEVNSNSTYKSLFKSDPEHLADCMARNVGKIRWNTKSCTSAQLNFAKKVWNKEFVPKPVVPNKAPIKAGDFVAIDKSGVLWNYGNKAKGNPARVKIGQGWADFKTVSTGDFTGDGVIDIVASDKAGKLWLYPGRMAGGFAAKKQIGHGWQNFKEIRLVKMKKSSKYADILAIHNDGKLYRYPSTGTGFAAKKQLGHGWQQFESVNWGYFDGDDNIDGIAQLKNGTLRLYRTNGSSFIGETRKQVGHGWKGLKIASVSGAHGTNSSGFVVQNEVGKLLYYPFNGNGAFGTKKESTSGFGQSLLWVANSTAAFAKV